MTNKDFWQSISTIINNGFDKDGIIKLEDYAEQFFNKQLLLNATHQANSMAAQREVASMLLHPYSREQKLQQINSLRQKAASKEIVNEQRRKQQL